MTFVSKHWLGIAVLAAFVWYGSQMPPKFDTQMIVSGSLFLFLFGVWALRGFVRFLGRAFNHSLTESKRTVR